MSESVCWSPLTCQMDQTSLNQIKCRCKIRTVPLKLGGKSANKEHQRLILNMRQADCGCFKGMLVERGIYFLSVKWVTHFHIKAPQGHSAAACCSHQRLVLFCSRLKYRSTQLAHRFFFFFRVKAKQQTESARQAGKTRAEDERPSAA